MQTRKQIIEVQTTLLQRCQKCKIEIVAEPLGFHKNERTGEWEVVEAQFPPEWGRLTYNYVWSKNGFDGPRLTTYNLNLCGTCMNAIFAFMRIDPEKYGRMEAMLSDDALSR